MEKDFVKEDKMSMKEFVNKFKKERTEYHKYQILKLKV